MALETRLPERPILCLVLDWGASRSGRPLAATVACAVESGVDWVQVRDRSLQGSALLELTDEVVRAARGARRDARVLVNRRGDVVLAAGADGIHLGFDACPPDQARALLGPDALIGASFHDPGEPGATDGLDYAHLAPIFAPISKPPERASLGTTAVARAATHCGIPILAQGGVTAQRARACLDAGAAGVAVTGAILAAADPAEAAAALRRALDA